LILIGVLFIAGIALEWRSLWRKKLWKEWIVQLSFIAASMVMAFLVQLNVQLPFDPLGWINAIFRPVTKWLYQIM